MIKLYKMFSKSQKKLIIQKNLKLLGEDISKVITKEEAIESAKEEIKRFGLTLENDQINKIQLVKNPNFEEIEYDMTTSDGLRIIVDAVSGNFKSFYLEPNISLSELEKCNGTREEILNVAQEKMREYGFGDEYKLSYVSYNDGNDEEKSYYWYITYSKEYNGVFCPTERVSMTIIPKINFVYALNLYDESFENNEILISEEQAINIAKEKDDIVNTEKYIVKNIYSELSIKRMNPEVYLKENNLENGMESVILEDGTEYSYYSYRMNGRVRMVYLVEISYENRPLGLTRKYYVDATTGEVVGGEDIFDKIPQSIRGEEVE